MVATTTSSVPPAGAPGAHGMHAFLVALASADPSPGGGAAAALGGALAAALVAMVGRVTAARDPSIREEMSATALEADDLRERLTGLVTQDMDAYRGVLDARRSGQPGAAELAHTRATEVPLMIARDSQHVLAMCEATARRARRSTLSDLGVAATLAWAALEAGALTARTNLGDLRDVAFVEAAERELASLLTIGREAHGRAVDTIGTRTRDRDQPGRGPKRRALYGEDQE
jgi:formiminotetrahydrofolate cyclodeaminase